MGDSTKANPPPVTLPEVGGMKPVTMRMVVDLPAPLGPRKPRTSPRSTVKVTSSTARLAPNVLTRFSIRIMAFIRGAADQRSDRVHFLGSRPGWFKGANYRRIEG